MIANNPDMTMENKLKIACSLAAISVTKQGTQTSYPGLEELKQVLNESKLGCKCAEK